VPRSLVSQAGQLVTRRALVADATEFKLISFINYDLTSRASSSVSVLFETLERGFESVSSVVLAVSVV
jgi:hypothetical protein